jgi:hypothetical protein
MIDLRSPRRRHAGANAATRGLWNASARKVQSRSATVTPVGAVARGLVAGAVGTATMDTFLFARYRRSGGDSSAEQWESSAGVTSWEQAPAPALVGKRLVEGLFGIQLAPSRARLVNNVMHWAYGILNGAQYGIVAESLPTARLPFGATVWAGDYVILPAAKLYKPIWAYDAKTLANDLSAHLVYGLATAAALSVLSPRHE